jgi:hypothetical protein
MDNREWKWVYISLLSAVLFIIIATGANATMDCFSGGCAITLISVFLAVASLAVALLFLSRARAMDAILGGRRLLAHWVYPAEDTGTSAFREFEEYREMNRSLLFIVGGMLVIAMILALILGGDAGITTAGMLLVVLVLISIVSWGAPRLELTRARNAPREVYIAENGFIYEGAVYSFLSFMLRMDGVRFREGTDKRPPMLVFSFLQLVGLFILKPFEINIPIPVGDEVKAREIVERLGGTGERGGSGTSLTKGSR